jgi:hypothetical protein
MARSLDDLIGNGTNYIDSRDLIERFEELDGADPLDDDDREELAELREIVEEGEGLPDWQYGETLIPEHEWVNYCRELAEDIGAISGDEQWPLNCIDWDHASKQLKMDYSVISIRGVDYYGRS